MTGTYLKNLKERKLEVCLNCASGVLSAQAAPKAKCLNCGTVSSKPHEKFTFEEYFNIQEVEAIDNILPKIGEENFVKIFKTFGKGGFVLRDHREGDRLWFLDRETTPEYVREEYKYYDGTPITFQNLPDITPFFSEEVLLSSQEE